MEDTQWVWEELQTHRVEISHGLHLLIVVCTRQLCKAFWVKLAAVGEELGPVLFGQLRPKRVDGDDEGSPVCLELTHKEVRATGDRLTCTLTGA